MIFQESTLYSGSELLSLTDLAMYRFSFGLKGDIRNNVHFLDDQKILYPIGHNIVVYYIDDESQTYYQGIQGSEGITAVALSPQKK